MNIMEVQLISQNNDMAFQTAENDTRSASSLPLTCFVC